MSVVIEALCRVLNYFHNNFVPLVWVLYNVCKVFHVRKPRWNKRRCVFPMVVPKEIYMDSRYQKHIVIMKNYLALLFTDKDEWYRTLLDWVKYIYFQDEKFYLVP